MSEAEWHSAPLCLGVYTALGQKLRFFGKAESAIFDRGYYITFGAS